MASKFGGVPVDEKTGSKFGGTPVPDEASAPPSAMSRFGSGLWNNINPVPLLSAGNEAMHGNFAPVGELGKGVVDASADQLKQSGQGFKDAADSSFPLSARAAGLGSGLIHAAGAIPMIGPPAIHAGEEIGKGNVAGGLGESAGILAPMVAPHVIGAGLKAAAPPLAENSLGIRGTAKAYGATPGKFAVNETGAAVRPESVAAKAGARVGELSDQVDDLASNSPKTASLAPTIKNLQGKKSSAVKFGSRSTPDEIDPMIKQLTIPTRGFGGDIDPNTGMISEDQPLSQFNGMKRQFNKDFISNWNPQSNTKGQLGTARSAYGDQASAFHDALPEAKPLDQRISSGIPVRDRASLVSMNQDPFTRALARMAPHTGAAAAGAIGFAHNGIPGLVGGILGPELLANPTVQMIGAKSMNLAGKVLTHPAAGPISGGASLIRKRKDNEEQ